MDYVIAVGCVEFKTLFFVKLASQVHVEDSLAILLHHKVVVASLLVQKRFEHHAVCKYVRYLDQRACALLVLVEGMKKLNHHKRRLYYAMTRVICYFVVLFVDLLSVGNQFFELDCRVISIHAKAGVQPKFFAVSRVLERFYFLEVIDREIYKLSSRLVVLDHES